MDSFKKSDDDDGDLVIHFLLSITISTIDVSKFIFRLGSGLLTFINMISLGIYGNHIGLQG